MTTTAIRPSAILKDGDKLETLAANSEKIMASAGKFVLPFISQSTVTVTHNLGRFPVVTLLDSAGTEYIPEVKHLSLNHLTITMTVTMSGTIYCH